MAGNLVARSRLSAPDMRPCLDDDGCAKLLGQHPARWHGFRASCPWLAVGRDEVRAGLHTLGPPNEVGQHTQASRLIQRAKGTHLEELADRQIENCGCQELSRFGHPRHSLEQQGPCGLLPVGPVSQSNWGIHRWTCAIHHRGATPPAIKPAMCSHIRCETSGDVLGCGNTFMICANRVFELFERVGDEKRQEVMTSAERRPSDTLHNCTALNYSIAARNTTKRPHSAPGKVNVA